MKIKVYPTSDASLNIKHPTDGPLRKEGSDWTYDGYTCRMLADNAVTETAPAATPADAPAPAPAPAAPSSTKAPSVG